MSSTIMKPFYTLIMYWGSIYIGTYITLLLLYILCNCNIFSSTVTSNSCWSSKYFYSRKKAVRVVSALLLEAQTKEVTILEKPFMQACITNFQCISLCNPSLCHNELGPGTLYIHLGCFWIHQIAALVESTRCMLSLLLGGAPTSICHFFRPSVRPSCAISQEPYIMSS